MTFILSNVHNSRITLYTAVCVKIFLILCLMQCMWNYSFTVRASKILE